MWRCACALALLCAALTRCNSFKRAEKRWLNAGSSARESHSRLRMATRRHSVYITAYRLLSTAPFVLGSRYGRSPPRMIAPRNDRFFMGSRYGKRSETPLRLAERSLQPLPDAWRELPSICEIAAFAPLCSAASKSLYNRLEQRFGDKMAYQD